MKTALVAVAVVALLAAGLYSHFSSPPLPSPPPPQSMQPVVGAPTGSCVQPMLVIDITSGIMYYCGNDGLWHAVVVSFTSPNGTINIGSSGFTFTLDTANASASNSFFYGDIQPGLLSASTLFGPPFYLPNAAKLKALTVRVVGSLICATQPTIGLMDLGTSVSTVYGSASAAQTLATSGSGAYSSGSINVSLTSGHYYSFAITTASCVTPPTVDAAATIQ